MGLLRSLLVHLDASRAAAARLEAARALALQHEAALSAMYVATPPQHPLQLALSESPAALAQDTDWSALEATRRRFDDAVAQGGPAMQWLQPQDADAVDAFCRAALYADLLVLGQHDPEAAPGMAAPPGFVEAALLQAGRPALVLPAVHRGPAPGHTVLVGWNATPAAAHAVTAALPWLGAARQVHVLQATEDDAPPPSGGLDIVRYLGYHGIVARLHRQRASAREAGDVLLSSACDVGADLLVMGCYGRSRASEVMLGGASRTVLRSMTLPVLMAH